MSHPKFAPRSFLPTKKNIRDECECARLLSCEAPLLSKPPARYALWSASSAGSAQVRGQHARGGRQLSRNANIRSNMLSRRAARLEGKHIAFLTRSRQLAPEFA